MRYLKTSVAVCCMTLLLGGCVSGVRVRKGDTLYGISQKNDVPMRAIIEENKLEPPYILSVGQYLYFPKKRTYRVRKSDTLYSISKRYDMSVSDLSRLNNIPPPYQIHPGQLLKISSWVDEDDNSENSKKTASKNAGSVKQDKQNEIKRNNSVKDKTAFQGEASVPNSQKKKKFSWPISGNIIQDFGSGNDGINISGKIGDTVKATADGTIAYAGNELKGYGNLVLIKHADGWISAYAHNDKLSVKKGDNVKQGQKIAELGQTGRVKKPQLHFELRYKTKVVNPRNYLK